MGRHLTVSLHRDTTKCIRIIDIMALAIEHTNEMNDMMPLTISRCFFLLSLFEFPVLHNYHRELYGVVEQCGELSHRNIFWVIFLQQAVDQNINRRLSTTCRMFSSWASCTENSSDRSPVCPNLSASDIFWTDERSLFLMLVSKAKQMPSWESQRIQSSYRWMVKYFIRLTFWMLFGAGNQH